MKKVVVVLLLLLAAQTCQAVDLQAGWYAWWSGYVEGIAEGTGGGTYTAFWEPSSSLGEHGPFVVSEWAGYPGTRKLTVSADTSVEPGVLFEDVWNLSEPNRAYQWLYLAWGTDYDASKMRLQLYIHRLGTDEELVWQQAVSGRQVGDGGNIWNTSPIRSGDQLIIRVIAVPEPCSAVALTCGMSALCWQMRRRKR